jgi:hypothetical protein
VGAFRRGERDAWDVCGVNFGNLKGRRRACGLSAPFFDRVAAVLPRSRVPPLALVLSSSTNHTQSHDQEEQ